MVSSTSRQKSQMAAAMSLISLLACFGPLVSAQDLPPESCPETNPFDYALLLPHPTTCSSFFICSDGVPIERHCSAGRQFNAEWQVCVSPQNANCMRECSPLQNEVIGTWAPASCTAGVNGIGASCKLKCKKGYQLRGSSSVQCTDKGWKSVNGDFIPKCLPEECIGIELDNDLNKTLSGKAGILFVLDDSLSVGRRNFEKMKVFVKDVVQKYPLSKDRSAGVITFDDNARVNIHLNVESTSDFLKEVDKIKNIIYGTRLLPPLYLANEEIKSYSKHNLTVIVLITDGISDDDGTPAADIIKKAGNPLFAIGIHANNNLVHLESLSSPGDNGIKHFFHITSYAALENIGKYLNPPAVSGGSSVSSKCKN